MVLVEEMMLMGLVMVEVKIPEVKKIQIDQTRVRIRWVVTGLELGKLMLGGIIFPKNSLKICRFSILERLVDFLRRRRLRCFPEKVLVTQ